MQGLVTYWRFGLFWILTFFGFLIGGLLANNIALVAIPLRDLITGAIASAALGLPLSQVQTHLAQRDLSAAVAVLESFRQQVETRGWHNERLKVMVLQTAALHALAIQASGLKIKADQGLGDALSLVEPDSSMRIFVDEGIPMAQFMPKASAHEMMPCDSSLLPPAQLVVVPLSEREMEVLQLIAQGLSNDEISERLFLALSTVKGHNQMIFGKLQVQRRTEAVARARELDLIYP
jgi:LuxR family maltose regulon positive regulatory protein